jgi:hypothetical protein
MGVAEPSDPNSANPGLLGAGILTMPNKETCG